MEPRGLYLATPPTQIRVFCRIRPNPRSAVLALPDGLSVRLPGPDGKEHTFTYDKVFKPEASQVGGETQWDCILTPVLPSGSLACSHLHARVASSCSVGSESSKGWAPHATAVPKRCCRPLCLKR